ncbi:MAG TPA: hypothetical protein VER38_05295 [Candidatus Eisenbacteria bacterium]|nr:hypothetical protein [Candidatus Eisenbacteria bacterium]
MHCVNCGRELEERGCKVRCAHCGYFEDCSDPSAPGEWSKTRSAETAAPAGDRSAPDDVPGTEL